MSVLITVLSALNAAVAANVITDCSAAGDGVTDDTADIQYCLDNYEDVYFPPGTYLVMPASGSLALNIPSNRHVHGAGVTSVIKSHGSIGSDKRLMGVSATSANVSDIIVENLALHNDAASSGEQSHAMFFYSSSYQVTDVVVRNVTVLETAAGDGIYFGANTQRIAALNNQIYNVMRSGIVIAGSDSQGERYGFRIIGNHVVNPDGRGVDIENSPGADVHDVVIANNILEGPLEVGRSTKVVIANNVVNPGFIWTTNVEDGTFTGNVVDYTHTAGEARGFKLYNDMKRIVMTANVIRVSGAADGVYIPSQGEDMMVSHNYVEVANGQTAIDNQANAGEYQVLDNITVVNP